MPDKARIAAAQYFLRPISSFADFEQQVNKVVSEAVEQGAHLLTLPEYFSFQLASLHSPEKDQRVIFRQIADYAETTVSLLANAAKRHQIYIAGGSIPIIEGEQIFNDCFFFAPDGSYEVQGKLHATRYERVEVGLSVRDCLSIFETSLGKVAINICYDVEFPELARAAAREGIVLLLVPSWTDDERGFYRVRYCAQARCIENHIYVAHSSVVGYIRQEPAVEPQYGEAAILGPSDVGFADKGIIARGQANTDQVVVGEIDLALLHRIRESGAVTPLVDSSGIESRISNLRSVSLMQTAIHD